ncbi:hypothetical protein EOM39_04650 [Candidatus Gracilibacteria bacterium]|nr:hypothetical protein [Candidatus Gracilibacteria bacterium]
MKINKKIWLPIALSIILFLSFPFNFLTMDYPLGIFYLIYLVSYIILFLIPIIIVYKKKLSYIYYIGIVFIGSIIFLIIGYYGSEYGHIKDIEESKKTLEKVEHLQKLMNERDVNKLEDKFKNIKASSNQDISSYQEDIVNTVDEFLNNIGIITLETYISNDGYTKKKLLIEGDKSKLEILFYINGYKLEGIIKNKNDTKLPKGQEICYTSRHDCPDKLLVLFDFIQKINIDK